MKLILTNSSLENNFKSDRLMEVNRCVSEHSKDAAESASKSQKSAEETSEATRINVQVRCLSKLVCVDSILTTGSCSQYQPQL
jgi:hypothetical protein